MIVIVDYGMGNLGSITNMFKKIGVTAHVSSDRATISEALKLILPGVGSFDRAVEGIEKRALRQVLDEHAVVQKKPILGICLGMQLLTSRSEEGSSPGLGWIAGSVKRFPAQNGLRIPHMGWNETIVTSPDPFISSLDQNSRFYFVHSYYVQVEDAKHSLLRCRYGVEFDAVIRKNNIFGAQFHPEKSHRYGMAFLKSFAML